MANPYSEYETQQARQPEQAEYNSLQGVYSGPATGMQPTYQQAGAQQHTPQVLQGSNNYGQQSQSNILALALIILGSFALIHQIFSNSIINVEAGITLLTLSSAFLFFAFWKRIYGLLIPGSILAGLAVGVTFADISNGVSVLWGLAAGFAAIDVVGRFNFGTRGGWGTTVAAILFTIGSIVFVTNLPSILGGFAMLIPLGLIGAGVWLGRNRLAVH